MYKRPINTKRTIILKTLANTRKLLAAIAEEIKACEELNSSWVFSYKSGPTLPPEYRKNIEKARVKRLLYELKRRKFIEIRRKGDTMICRLTDKGRISALKDQIRIADERRDGKIVLVSFDIPEQESVARSKLRYFLKDCGFKRHQLSLWASKQDVSEKVAELVKDLGAQKWISIFIASEIVAK